MTGGVISEEKEPLELGRFLAVERLPDLLHPRINQEPAECRQIVGMLAVMVRVTLEPV